MMETLCQSNGCNPNDGARASVKNNELPSRKRSARSLTGTYSGSALVEKMSSTQKIGRAKTKLARPQRTKEYNELRLAYLDGELGTVSAPNRAGTLFDFFWAGYFGETRKYENRDQHIAFAAGRDAAAKAAARAGWKSDGINGVNVTDFQRQVYAAVPDDRFSEPGIIAQQLGIDPRRCGSALVALAEKKLISRRQRASGAWTYRKK